MSKTAALVVALALVATQDKEKLFIEDKDGFIVIEAEHFHSKVDKDPHKWVATKEPAGFSGDGAMEAKPNEDANNDGEEYADISPRLDYKVKFAKAGKYRVWVRGYGKTDSDNSVHVGLDGKAVATSARIGDFATEEWAWQNETKDNEPATMEIKEAGTRTLNLFMREDGFVADKILLTRDDKYTPKEKGPAESRE
jgi:hypothetical protein